MDALKLKLRAKDQLHPILSELMSSYSKLNKSAEWEGRPKILQWYALVRMPGLSNVLIDPLRRLITLNQMSAHEEITEEQSRQVVLPRSK
jgi:ESCRT-I complex subunit VPS28